MYKPKSKRVQKRAKQIFEDFVDGLENGKKSSELYKLLAKKHDYSLDYIRRIVPVHEAHQALIERYESAAKAS
ncbi:hypothetical protein [Phaeocystidibacter luteus]|uniref:Uncharacterized protein n=1 Tax=Phaeocystidibacter luteus TaxID=911197 RepID=A0A6N6RLY1_9FLAO|nr:hypothetical protein [Phaeocystidibacter luteus]KAB2814587.1 hypothetical protein F8C67_02270 [Phaeocystidibacter luteus]